MTVCMYLVYEGCGSGHFTVDGADDDLKTRDKCGSGQLGPATDGPGPGERQRRRARELRGWRVRV